MMSVCVRGAMSIALCVGIAATGCTTMRTGVDKRMVLPENAARYTPDAHETFLMAVPIDNRLPVFPADAGRGTQPVPVCADVVVAASGSVGDIAIVRDPAPCDARIPDAARLEAAVRETLAHWSFFGAGVCTFPPGVARNDTCDGVEVRAVPIRLRYVFTFETRTRGVRAQRAGPSH